MNSVFVYPCNAVDHDIEKHFADNPFIVWRAISDIKVDDIVFIYVGKTIREVKYKCIVTKCPISQDILNDNQYAIPKGKLANKCSYLMMKLQKEYPNGVFPLSELKENGMKQFMVPMHASDRLKQYFQSKDEGIGGC